MSSETGLIKPNSGRVFLDEEDISEQPMYKRAQMGIGYLAQEASVFRQMSVEDNIASVMQFKKGMSKQQQREKLEDLLDEFGLQHVRKSKGIQLSGGERRRTEIARALAVDPNFILLDEPFDTLRRNNAVAVYGDTRPIRHRLQFHSTVRGRFLVPPHFCLC